MAEIVEKISKALQDRAIPTAQRLQTIISNVVVILREKAIEMAREINTPAHKSSRGRKMPPTGQKSI